MADLQQLFQLGQQVQGRLQQLQSELAGRTVEATAGAGLVRVTVDGRGMLRSLTIDPEAFAGRDADLLSDLVLSGVAEGPTESFFLRLDGSDLSRRYRVAYRHGCFAGYLIAFACDEVWTVREAGAVDGDPATAAAMLRAGGAEAYAAGFRSVEGWFHQEVKQWLPEWNLRFRPRPQAIPMILPLAGDDFVPGRMSVDEAFIPFLDQF